MKEPLGLPANLLDAASQEGRSDWLRNLPEVVAVVERIWSVRVGEPFQPGGQTAWVAPASGTDHDLVVKIAWRHPEAAHEADGLRIWDGNGAVRLHAVEEIDGSTLALLLERCHPGTTLETLPEPEQGDHRRLAASTLAATTGRWPVPAASIHVRSVGGAVRGERCADHPAR